MLTFFAFAFLLGIAAILLGFTVVSVQRRNFRSHNRPGSLAYQTSPSAPRNRR